MCPSLPADDAPIGDETPIYRWIPREKIVPDKALGGHRPSSDCFRNTTDTDEFSVILGDTLAEQGRDPRDLLEDRRSVGALTAAFLRDDCQRELVRTPKVDEPQELAHGSSIGEEKRKTMTKMAQAAACIEHGGDWEKAKQGREAR